MIVAIKNNFIVIIIMMMIKNCLESLVDNLKSVHDFFCFIPNVHYDNHQFFLFHRYKFIKKLNWNKLRINIDFEPRYSLIERIDIYGSSCDETQKKRDTETHLPYTKMKYPSSSSSKFILFGNIFYFVLFVRWLFIIDVGGHFLLKLSKYWFSFFLLASFSSFTLNYIS